MRIRTEKGHLIRLGASSFVATGGEATVYAVGDTAYKIYTDPARVPSTARLGELARLSHPSIVLPHGIVTDPDGGHAVGISLPFIDGSMPLASLVARSAKKRHGLNFTEAIRLMACLQDAVSHCHSHGIQIVDLNTLNILVRTGRGSPELFLIDVDSWQCAGHPATALQEAVRDRRTPRGVFSAETDWFSYAVVAVQFLLGVHPYKGKHATVHGLEARMMAQISIFDAEVRTPPVCIAPGQLPRLWREWVERVLQTDHREPPPRLLAPPHPVPDRRVFIENRLKLDPPQGPWVQMVAPRSGRPVRVVLEDHRLKIQPLDGSEAVPFGLQVDAISICEGRVNLQSGPRILELKLHEMGRRLVASTVARAQVRAQATRLYDGLVIQDLLGSAWISRLDLPGMSPQIRLPELDGLRVVQAQARAACAQVWTDDRGCFDRLDLRFDAAGSYIAQWTRDVELESVSMQVE